jgi:hypothetical protein
MYGIGSDLICRVIGKYRTADAVRTGNDDADYRRYLQLEDLLTSGDLAGRSGVGAGEMSKESREGVLDTEVADPDLPEVNQDNLDTDVELEKGKEKKLKGGGGVSGGVSRMFRDMLEDYMPGGYFAWEEYARNLSDNFYKMAYAQFKDLLPKLISGKLKDFNIDRSEGTIETDSETVNKVIMDSLVYMHDHPEILKDGLIRAYRRREGDENRGVGIADAFFVPRVDEAALAERLKGDSGEGVKVGDADEEVLSSLKDRNEVKWKWRGIDEYGILRFTLPELYGSREFTVKLPSEIQTIKPGTYTFRIKNVVEGRGAVLEFKEQHEGISGNALSSIEEDGLGEDQLRKFINNGIINKYVTFLRSLPAEKLVEDFLGTFTVGQNQISGADDLAELIKLEGGGDESTKGRGKEKVREKFQESVGRQRDKLRAMIQRWERAPEIAKYFMKVSEEDGTQIARIVASKFPRSLEDETGVPTFAGLFGTAPVVEMVLRYIMSPHMPLAGGGKSMPWVHFAWEALQKMVLKEPSVRASMEKIIRYKRKDVPGSSLPVTDEEIGVFMGSQGDSSVSKYFQRLRDSIGEAVTASRGAPELKRFFERREIFKSYIQNQLGEAVEQYVKENGLSVDSPEDVIKIEKFKDAYIKKAVDRMSKSAGQDGLIRQLMIRMSV